MKRILVACYEVVQEVCYIHTKRIPSKYDYVDIYLQNYHRNKEKMKECSITFTNQNKELFSYGYKSTIDFESIFLGTLGKVSNGWKFYPMFKTYKDDMNSMLEKKYFI